MSKPKMMNRLYILIILGLLSFTLWTKYCGRHDNNSVRMVSRNIREEQIVRAGASVTINPSNYNVNRSSSSKLIQGSDNRSDVPATAELSTLARQDDILWSADNGDVNYKWYGACLAPGVSFVHNSKNPGLGIDIRGLYLGDFGLQVGGTLFRNESLKPTVSIGYTLRRIDWLRNTDLIVGMNFDKDPFFGIRAELGRKR